MELDQAHERQELASQLTRERAARLHLWLQGGPIEPTGEDLEWCRTWFPDLFALTKIRFANGSIPPSSEYHMERARRFIAGDLDALTDGGGAQGSGGGDAVLPSQYDGQGSATLGARIDGSPDA